MYDSHGVDAAAKMIVDMILKRLIVGVVNIKEFVGSFLENFFHLLKVWPLLHFNIQLKRNIHPNIWQLGEKCWITQKKRIKLISVKSWINSESSFGEAKNLFHLGFPQ